MKPDYAMIFLELYWWFPVLLVVLFLFDLICMGKDSEVRGYFRAWANTRFKWTKEFPR